MIEATPMIIPHTPNFTPFLPSIKLILEAYRLCQNVMSSYKDFSEHTVSLISFLSFELISVGKCCNKNSQYCASPNILWLVCMILRSKLMFLVIFLFWDISESVWFTDQRPAEIHDFWMSAYTEIDTVPNKVAQIQKAGYIPVATFILPENCWIEHYFAPQAKAEEIFRRKHAGSRIVEELITSNHHEAELYSKYKAYYGYAFFICKKGFSLRR